MPNWCDNELRISGAVERVKDCLAAIGGEGSAIDFQRIVPMPAILEDTESPTDWWVMYLLGVQNEDALFLLDHLRRTLKDSGIDDDAAQRAFLARPDASEQLKELVKKQHAEWEQVCEAVQRLITETGFSNWYDWNLAHWGTKWAADCGEADLEEYEDTAIAKLHFDTAWSPPTPIVQALGERFPDLEFSLVYYEGGSGFHGLFLMEEGEIAHDECVPYFGDRGG